MRTISRISAGSLKPTALFSFGLLALFVQVGRAQDPLQFFKNYFVTGDYAVAGVGLYGQGINGFASNTLAMTGVPCTAGGPGPGTTLDAACATAGAIPAEPIAAFLIWQSIETTPSPSSANGWFRNWPITGSVAGNPQGLGCWSNGGTNPSGFLRVYIADVLRFLPFDETKGVRIANGAYTVKLVDSGGGGNGQATHTFGASLLVVYRIAVPGAAPALAPLRGVSMYLGDFVSPKASAGLTQTIGGFYDATGGPKSAKMTHIVANGQAGFGSTITVNGSTVGMNAFTGTAGNYWDNVTFDISSPLGAEAGPRGSFQTQVTSIGNQTCLS
jgi:hypothetical protein